MRSVAALILLYVVASPQAGPPTGRVANPVTPEPVRQLISSLPNASSWRAMLERGARGDGVHRPWMDDMRREGVKLATFTFEFDWVQGGKELKNWTLVSEQYFRDYDHRQRITDGRQLQAIEASGVARKLEPVALARAKRGIWVEYPAAETGTGYKQVFLADNEWLPVQMFPWFGQYAPGTTPLMHAAVLGDVARIRKLLDEGAAVDAARSDGVTAVMYAAGSGNPAAVEELLRAGADANRKTRDGDDALINAAAGGDARSVDLLLRAGADPNSRDREGQSALSIAIQRHYANVAKMLERAGARQ